MTKIIYKQGDVTLATERFIAHGCNAQGVMGSGVAKAIRARFPKAYESYRGLYEAGGLELGSVIMVAQPSGKVIVNLITQDRFGVVRRYVDYEALYKAMAWLDRQFDESWMQGEPVAMPRIGAGLGGGNWRIIETMIEETANHYQPVVYDL